MRFGGLHALQGCLPTYSLQRAASQRPQRMTREKPYDALGGSAVSLTFIPGSSSHAFTRAVSISEE